MEMLAHWLNQEAFSALGNPLSKAEVLGFATGLACVWLTVRRHILNFPVGIANCLLLLFLFWQARLFADATLQVLFIVLGLQGWWWWAQGRKDGLPVSGLARADWPPLLALTVAMTLALYGVLAWAKGSVPLLDALITTLSLVAQWLLNRRKRETWYFWITVDLVSIPLYAYKGLFLIALLYAVFLGLCVAGLRAWQREAKAGPATSAVAGVPG